MSSPTTGISASEIQKDFARAKATPTEQSNFDIKSFGQSKDYIPPYRYVQAIRPTFEQMISNLNGNGEKFREKLQTAELMLDLGMEEGRVGAFLRTDFKENKYGRLIGVQSKVYDYQNSQIAYGGYNRVIDKDATTDSAWEDIDDAIAREGKPVDIVFLIDLSPEEYQAYMQRFNQIESILAPGGIIILTMDLNDIDLPEGFIASQISNGDTLQIAAVYTKD